MKKSKVIIPAMALLLFSTAASVTGTVAWFSSTRTFITSANQFTVKEVEGGLEAVVSGGVGTQAYNAAGTATATADYGTDAKTIKSKANCLLTHGSFNPDLTADGATNRQAWIINRDSESNDTHYASKGTLKAAETTNSNWVAYTDTEATPNSYYVAFSWTIKFTYTFNSETKNVGLYFNQQASKLTVTPGTGGAANSNTFSAFRIAFMPLTASDGDSAAAADAKVRLWCATAPSTEGKNYVYGSSAAHVSTHADDDYMACNSAADVSADNDDTRYWKDNPQATDATTAAEEATNKARSDRLCTFKKAGTGNVIYVKCVAWFEGEDVNTIKSGNRLDTVKADMSFYARSDNSNA